MRGLGRQSMIDIGLARIVRFRAERTKDDVGCPDRCDDELLTSLPALTHPLTSWIKPRPIILKSMIRVRGSSTCSFVARSDLSFMFAYELGPFLLTPTPIMYGTSILAKRDEYLARVSN